VAKELGVADQERLFSAKLDVFNVATGGSPVEAGVDLVEAGGRLRGWIFPGLINRGVRKLLTESAQAELAYPALVQALRSRWIHA
jgi:hypothetical protein